MLIAKNRKGEYLEEELPTNVTIFKNVLWMEDCAFRMERWLEGEKWGPLKIDAELHRRCNLNCRMCARRASPIDLTQESKRIEMSTQRWVELVRESAKIHTKVWNISGLGEPMCKPTTLFAVMEMIKACGMFGELTTNGTLWSEKDVRRTVEIGWDSVCISIDAPDAKTHDYLRRVKGTFKRATQTVRLFKFWRDKLSSDVPSITIKVVLNKLNYKKLPQMVVLASKLGADAIFVEPMIVYTPLGEELKLNEKEMQELPQYIKETRDLAKEYCIATTITCITPEKELQQELVKKTSNIRSILLEDAEKYKENKILSIPCYYPWFFLMIRADGSAIHCGECKDVSDNVRNKSLLEVWTGKVLEDIRNEFQKGLPSYCEMCRPNVIEDMREIRRAIINFSKREYLQQRILDLLKENVSLKKQLFRLRLDKGITQKELERLNEALEHERELMRFKNSLSYKIGKIIGETPLGKIIKRAFGIYV